MMDDDAEMDGLLVRRLGSRRAWQFACPDAGLVAAWMEGSLSPEQNRRVSDHAASCPVCSETIAEAAKGDALDEPCPTVAEWLAAGAGRLNAERTAALRAHAEECPSCSADAQLAESLPEACAGLLALCETQSRLRVLGVVLSLSWLLEIMRRRQAGLAAAAAAELHRSRREGHLGVSGARPASLMWAPGSPEENTWLVELQAGEIPTSFRVHAPAWRIPPDHWQRLGIVPEQRYAWSVQGLRRDQPVGPPMRGMVWFLSAEQERALNREETACRSIEDESQRTLALGILYDERGLWWEAHRRFEAHAARHPQNPLGHVLQGRVLEEMGRYQEAAAAFARANQLMH